MTDKTRMAPPRFRFPTKIGKVDASGNVIATNEYEKYLSNFIRNLYDIWRRTNGSDGLGDMSVQDSDDVDITGGDLEGVVITESDISLSDIDQVNIAGSNITTSDMSDCDIDSVNITNSEISGCTVDACTITDSSLVTDEAVSITGEFNVDHLDFDTTPTALPNIVGRVVWNAVDDTLDLVTNGNTYQWGQETALRYKNQSGVDIPNGCPVMYDGAVGISGIIKIKKAIADGSFPSGHTLGITTEAIANGSDGKATWFGKIRGLNTTGAPYGEVWADGDILYISPTTAGYLTNVRPSAPHLAINMAVVVNTHAVNGEIHVRPTWGQKLIDLDDVNGTPATVSGQISVWDEANGYFDLSHNINDKAPQYNGVMDGTKWTVTYDPGTRIFTVVVAAGGAYVVVDGIQGFVAEGTYTTTAHADTTNTYYCVVDATYAIVGSASFTFFGVAILAYAYYNATTKLGIGFNEKHPAAPGWPASMHRHFHQVDGAKLISGGTVSTYNLGENADTDMQVSIDETVFDDESLRNTCAALTGGNGVYTHWYRSGADAAGEWSWATGANLPILEDTDNPQYNQLTGGNWVNTTVSDNNRWINVYLIATNSLDTAHRFVFIQGQTLHTTANSAANESFLNAISWGTLPFAENVPLAKITFQRATGTGNDFYITSVVSIRGTQASITSVTSPTVHNTLAGRSDAACHPAAAITYGLTTVDATLAALGTMSTQNANSVAITGGAIDGTTIGANSAAAGTFTTVNATTFDTNVTAAGVTLSGITLSADGTDENIDINITPKGTGEVNLTKVDIDAGTIDGVIIGGTNPEDATFDTIIVEAGSASLPSITTVGDTNTGIFFPPNDTIGVVTGGTERIRITSDGKVGFGTAVITSGAFVDILGGAVYIRKNSITGANNFIQFLTSSDTGKGVYGGIDVTNRLFYWKKNDSSDYAYDWQDSSGISQLRIAADGNITAPGNICTTHTYGFKTIYPYNVNYYGGLDCRDGNTYLTAYGIAASIILSSTSNTGVTSEVMRLSTTGVSIGTASSNYLLTLYKATLPVLQLINSTSGNTTADGLLLYLNGTNAVLSNNEAGSLSLHTGGTSRITIAADGDVGINEIAPDYKLDVNGTFGFTPGASVTPVDNGDVVFELTNNTTLTIKAKGSDGTVRSVALTLA